MTIENIRQPNRRRRLIIIIAAAIAVLIIGAGLFYYLTSVAPYSKTIATVDNTTITMRYFLKRAKLASGQDPSLVLQQITYEQIVKEMAPQYGITVSQSAIDETLRNEASAQISGNATGGAQLTDSEYTQWYADQLKKTGLTDGEYLDIVRTNLLAVNMQDYFASQVPTSGEQVDLYVILVSKIDDANSARDRILGGESFTAVAANVTLDDSTRDSGGHVGWIPRNITPYDDVIFQLDIGQVSEPVALDDGTGTSGYALFMISARESDRPMDAGPLQTLQARAFYDWMTQEIPRHTINFDVSQKTWQWVDKQLAKTSAS